MTTPTSTKLTDHERSAVQKVLGRMPYLPLTGRAHARVETVDDLVDLLSHFAEALGRVAEGNEKQTTELYRLQSVMRGGGALLAELTRQIEESGE